jgi:hypothetical protein
MKSQDKALDQFLQKIKSLPLEKRLLIRRKISDPA